MREQLYYQIGGFKGHVTTRQFVPFLHFSQFVSVIKIHMISRHSFRWSNDQLAESLFVVFMEKKIGGVCELLFGKFIM